MGPGFRSTALEKRLLVAFPKEARRYERIHERVGVIKDSAENY
jgi:hypothetical protein